MARPRGRAFFAGFSNDLVRLRALFSRQPPTSAGLRAIWVLVSLSICGTILVEMPFLLHLAGTKGWPKLSILLLGLGVIVVSGILLLFRRRKIRPGWALIASLNTAFLANAALCLVVYSTATGPLRSRSGWLITMVIVWPMALELVWIFGESFRTRASYASSVSDRS